MNKRWAHLQFNLLETTMVKNLEGVNYGPQTTPGAGG